jgi:LuxR family maltose regulon positive regulatory protein
MALEEGIGIMPSSLSRHADQGPIEALTSRELKVLRLLAQGLSNKEIADKLVVTVGTVKWYNNQIYTKLKVHSRTRAVARAREMRLLS